jgi:molybdopterin synthase sulfur carrier subunit
MGAKAIMRRVRVRVLYFAVLRDFVGRGEDGVELPPSVRTVGQLARHLETVEPRLSGRMGHVRIARNDAFASDDDPVADGDTIALIPPVAGG